MDSLNINKSTFFVALFTKASTAFGTFTFVTITLLG